MKIVTFFGMLLAGAAVAAPGADEIARENAHSEGLTVISGKENVQIALDRPDALYTCGEEAVFTVKSGGPHPASSLLRSSLRSGDMLPQKVSWVLDNYGTHVFAKGTVDLAKENPFTAKGTLPYPGFLRLTIRDERGKQLRAYSAAYEPEKIRTAVPRPDDFDAFWENAIAKLEKEVPLDPQVEQVPGWPKKGVNLQRVSFATVEGKRVYGILSTPTDSSKGPYPVRICFPGAGPGLVIKRCCGDSSHVSLYMNAHYYPVPDTDEGAKKSYEAQEAEWRKIHGPSRARAYPVGGSRFRARRRTTTVSSSASIGRSTGWRSARTSIRSGSSTPVRVRAAVSVSS